MTDQPLRIFLDTDIGPDCDDAAALAILLQLDREGKCALTGVTHCTGSPYGLATIDAICRLFDVHPVLGTCADKTFLADGAALCYTPSVAEKFNHGYPADAPQPDAVDALVSALSEAPDGSVTFIAIGPLNNVARYLTDPVAAPLMLRKVSRIVTMAGCFEGEKIFTEWNVLMDIPAARSMMEKWPGRIDFCPFEAAGSVLVGECLKNCRENPVSLAYRLHTKGSMMRPSWDLATVAAAVLGADAPYEWSLMGNVEIDEAGVTKWVPDPNGKHRYLRLTGDGAPGAAWLEELLGAAIAACTGA